jgi:hypothetical protein
MRTFNHSLLRLVAGSALILPLVLGSTACAAAAAAGGSEVTTVTGEPIRVKIMIVNESQNRAILTVGNTEIVDILPSSQQCVELPARVDNQDLRLQGTAFTIVRQTWSSQPFWRVIVPDTNTSPRLNAMAGAAC